MITQEICQTAQWNQSNLKQGRGFTEEWYFKLNDPDSGTALYLRCPILIGHQGFRKTAETWGVFFSRNPQTGEVSKFALKRAYELSDFDSQRGAHCETFRIGPCEFSDDGTRGVIETKDRVLKWNLKIRRAELPTFEFAPQSALRLGLVRTQAVTAGQNLLFTGTFSINDQEYEVVDAPGAQGHVSGPSLRTSWVWGHCNHFVDTKGQKQDLIFEGLTGRVSSFGKRFLPQFSSYLFVYRGERYEFNTWMDLVRLRSSHSHTEWIFQADRKGISFRGHMRAGLRDMAGLTMEDSNDTFVYATVSLVTDMNLLIYRDGKLEGNFQSQGHAALEIVERTKSPYVPFLV